MMLRLAKNLILRRPILAIYDVTKLCNQRCAICNVWKTKSEDMNLDKIAEKAKLLKKFGIQYVFLQGGEPTLRADLIDIIDIFIKNRIKPTVITNGTRIGLELAEAVSIRSCNLAISLDSLDRENYARIRGADTLADVVGNIETIAKYTNIKKGNWAITTTITRLSTLEEVKDIERFSHKNGFMFAIRPYVYVNGNSGKKNLSLSLDNDESFRIFRYMHHRSKQNNYLASLVYGEHIRYLSRGKMTPCDAMSYSLFLHEDGTISPCIELPNIQFNLELFLQEKSKLKNDICRCNKETPCFYNDAREVGILWRKKWSVLLHSPLIIRQLSHYGRFF